MELVYRGKTKDVYKLQDGNYKLQFKDDVTGADGVFDPGANSVGLQIEGMGSGALKMTTYFFKKLADQGIKTHWVSSDFTDTSMTVLPATMFGQGVEVICRYRAVGSFIRRYGKYAVEGQPLDALVEITLKDDDRGDPLVTSDILQALHIMTTAEYDIVKEMMHNICSILRDELAAKELELYDIKLEFGRVNGEIVLIDEISSGNMRVYKNGNIVGPLDLAAVFAQN